MPKSRPPLSMKCLTYMLMAAIALSCHTFSWADAAHSVASDASIAEEINPLQHPSDSRRQLDDQRRRYQSEHHMVKAVQKRLDVYGYRPGPIDGILGPRTKAALMAFQKDNGLTADGAIGIETLKRLDLIRKSAYSDSSSLSK